MTHVFEEGVALSEEQRLIRRSIREICEQYDHEYWRTRSEDATYPHEFVDTLGEHGWMGALIPPEYDGAGMSTPEVVVMMEEIAASGGGFSAAQSIHGGIYNSVPLVKYANDDLKADLLPKIARGERSIQAFGLTEPNAGSDSTAIETVAEKDGDGYVINGQKIWTSRADVSDYLVLVARTTPRDEVDKRTHGISMFLVDLPAAVDAGTIEMTQIPKTVSEFVHSFEVWIKDLYVPETHLIGEEGNGFYQVLDGLNEERVVIAAECLGLGELAIARGADYAREREVFGRPIGQNQAIQHPLASAYAKLQGAKYLTYGAAERVDSESGRTVGAFANMAKYLAAEAAYEAADAAVQTHGGFGVAREYDVERYFREARLTRIVPITQELILNFVGENVLDLPRSY